jgi:hypothetical protein
VKKPDFDFKHRLSQASFGNRGFGMSDVRDDNWLNNIFSTNVNNPNGYLPRDKMSFDFGAQDKKD